MYDGMHSNCMIVESEAFEGGVIAEKYGKRGTEFGVADMPALSFPLKISGAPAGTASYAIIFDDPDSVPPCGFKWVHWLVAGLKDTELAEDASRTRKDLIQGANSWYLNCTDDRQAASFYGGPAPPDRPHVYVLTVLALDFVPALKNGFDYETLVKVSNTHVLARAVLKGSYSNE